MTTATTPILRIPLTSGGVLEIPNPPPTAEDARELDRLELLADRRARDAKGEKSQ
jgi:hypothetical protein